MELIKVMMKEIDSKIDSAIENRRKECFCSIQELEDLEEMFEIPLTTVEDIETLEAKLNDASCRRNLVSFFLLISIFCFEYYLLICIRF